MNKNVQGFIIASRPKTLPAGAAPVILAGFLAAKNLDGEVFNYVIFVLTLICTILLQISSNLINDYYDTKTGVDTSERLGPHRVTNTGFIDAETVKKFFIATLSLAFIMGIYLMFQGGTLIVILGLASMAAAYLYTGGPFPLSHYALGEILALLFFGNVAVIGSYYLLTGQITNEAILLSIFPGLISSTIMAINNARDLENDRKADKLTMAIILDNIMGEKSRYLPMSFVLLANIIIIAHAYLYGHWYNAISVIVLTTLFFKTWKYIAKSKPNVEYNQRLAETGKFLFISSLIYGAIIWIS